MVSLILEKYVRLNIKLTGLCVAAKVISNRPGVGGSNPMTNIQEVGVYGSNPNLANNAAKVNVDSKCNDSGLT